MANDQLSLFDLIDSIHFSTFLKEAATPPAHLPASPPTEQKPPVQQVQEEPAPPAQPTPTGLADRLLAQQVTDAATQTTHSFLKRRHDRVDNILQVIKNRRSKRLRRDLLILLDDE